MAGLADSSGDRITIHGLDLAEELIGKIGFAEMLHLLAFGRRPTREVGTMLDAILVTLAEHGLTPSAIAARLTHLGAPDSLQGAVAAGLLGTGPALLGTTEQVAAMLQDIVSTTTEESRPAVVTNRVDQWLESGMAIPGFGHQIHKDGDRRATALRRLQVDLGLPDTHYLTAEMIAKTLTEAKARPLPMNAAGAIGAIVSDLGLSPVFARGLSLVARSAGLVAHVLEEGHDPIASRVWESARSEFGKQISG